MHGKLSEANDRHSKLEEKVDRPDTKMDIFWSQMDNMTNKVNGAIDKQSTEMRAIMRAFETKSEKISFVSQQL